MEDLGGLYTSAPAVASAGVHRLDVFAQAARQTMLDETYDGKFRHPADDHGSAIVRARSAAWGPDRLDVVVRGTDNEARQMAYAGGSWAGYDPLGGSLTSSPAVASWEELARRLHEGRRACALSTRPGGRFGWSPYQRLGRNSRRFGSHREARI